MTPPRSRALGDLLDDTAAMRPGVPPRATHLHRAHGALGRPARPTAKDDSLLSLVSMTLNVAQVPLPPGVTAPLK
jgi:hypothetical protein